MIHYLSIMNALVINIIALALISCTQLTPYRVVPDAMPGNTGRVTPSQFEPAKSRDCDAEERNCVHIVEFDEFGSAFNRGQLNSAISAAQNVAQENGTVLVYVHGWHHTAAQGDPDISQFLGSVKNAQSVSGKKAVGIYIGWRGDSIDSKNKLFGWSSYGFTFWDRKSTAHNVGTGGGVTELLTRLSSIRRNTHSRLLLAGHSFGGAALYSSISQIVATQVSTDQLSSDVTSVAGSHNQSLADLVVLLNPAFEATRVAPLYALARAGEYPKGKNALPPRLVLITTTADKATRYLFPLGRVFGTLFQAYPDDQVWRMDRTAVGHYIPYITHQLTLEDCPEEKSASLLNSFHDDESARYCVSGQGSVKSVLLQRCDLPSMCKQVADSHHLRRGLSKDGYIPEGFPFVNIRTTKDIIEGHNKIWTPTVQNFIDRLMADVIADPGRIPLVH